MRWIGGGLGCFSRYYNITHISLSAPACTACIDMVYWKKLEHDVKTSAMAKAILRLKTLERENHNQIFGPEKKGHFKIGFSDRIKASF